MRKSISSIIVVVVLILIGSSCSKENNIRTGFKNIDDNNKFNKKFTVDNDSLSKNITWYFKSSNQDSIYSVVIDSNRYLSRGWLYKDIAIGDWYYGAYPDDKLDSIVNYIMFCEKRNKNTIKKFTDNKLKDRLGNYHDIKFDETEVMLNKPIDVKMNLFMDTNLFKESLQFYIFKENHLIIDFCNFENYERDSLPFINNSIEFMITPTSIGRNTIQGYYLLLYNNKEDEFSVKPVFFDLNIDVMK